MHVPDPPQVLVAVVARTARFSGTLTFLGLHVLLFGSYAATGGYGHDPFPFSFGTLLLSVEAIVLGILVLSNQLREGDQGKVQERQDRADARDDAAIGQETLGLLRALHEALVGELPVEDADLPPEKDPNR